MGLEQRIETNFDSSRKPEEAERIISEAVEDEIFEGGQEIQTFLSPDDLERLYVVQVGRKKGEALAPEEFDILTQIDTMLEGGIE